MLPDVDTALPRTNLAPDDFKDANLMVAEIFLERWTGLKKDWKVVESYLIDDIHPCCDLVTFKAHSREVEATGGVR